ncbi:hypothetical protein MRS44_013049 [Fusarium solani]|uniref:uncharacterized protein n=1 Tax=Fusarium solani TaxID=169388 RepID=UPI0032C48924|nr:hypothetical protein MRS44_013049 [Fusarium solani]
MTVTADISNLGITQITNTVASAYDQQKTVVVIDGTGLFGGSVVISLPDNPEFHVQVTSRDPTSVKAKGVGDQGAEAVLVYSWKSDELGEALKGASALFHQHRL